MQPVEGVAGPEGDGEGVGELEADVEIWGGGFDDEVGEGLDGAGRWCCCGGGRGEVDNAVAGSGDVFYVTDAVEGVEVWMAV